MIKNNNGYIFEIKKNLKTMQQGTDSNGNTFPLYGVKEEFTFSFKGNFESVNLIFGLDGAFNVMKPAYYDIINGLTLVNNLFINNAEADLHNFALSHRPTYSVCPTLICHVMGKIDRSTFQWHEATKCDFFIQRSQGVVNINGTDKDCVYCDLYSPVKGLHTFCANDADASKIEAVRVALTNKVLTSIAPYLGNKEMFWMARLK